MATSSMTSEEQTVQTLEITKEMKIAASLNIVFETVRKQIGARSEMSEIRFTVPEGRSMYGWSRVGMIFVRLHTRAAKCCLS